MRVLFRDARLVDEARDGTGSLLVEEGLIAALGPEPPALPSRGDGPVLEVDCRGALLMPAFVDLHVHFRDPGLLDKERLESGCLAAAAGGFGTVVAMANTRPPTSDPDLALATRARAAELGLVDYFPVLTMTRDLTGADHLHLDGLEARLAGPGGAGLRIVSDDGRDVADEALLLSVFRRAAELGLVASCHCEIEPPEPPRGGGSPAETAAAAPWYASAEGRAADRRAEIAGVERALRLAEEAGCRLHLAHLSTRESVELVRQAKRRAAGRHGTGSGAGSAAGARVPAPPGAPAAPLFRITCEATPHHLALTEALAAELGASGAGRVNPWLRGEDDRRAVVEGLVDGTIDAIATDHAPHTASDKEKGAPGFSGLETAFALAHGTLVGGGALGASALSRLMSAGPARVLGLADRGRLEVGLRADLVLADPDAPFAVDPSRLRSRGKNTPLAGKTLRGRVLMTLHEGRIVHDES